ncbi:MAG TPA: hypothetical protein VGR69_00340 [Candidatus Rubrimentiphilum sp.]|nr:hypothetical protein [Candidatus Rubrimentiphilum sp.]
MSPLVIILLSVIVMGITIGVYAWLSPAKETPEEEPPAPIGPWVADTGWTAQAGEEFATLSEAARCDLVFAVADLQDERAEALLVHALDDPSESVALAAAHVLERRGGGERVRAHVNRYPGQRAQRIRETLEILR